MGSAAPVALEIGELRRLLLPNPEKGIRAATDNAFAKVANGQLPLVVHADKADILATIVNLKSQVEHETGNKMRWVM